MKSKVLRNIPLFVWFNFFVDFRFYSAVAILYFQQVTGSFALGMSVFSVTMFASAIFEVPTGIFSDMIGRRKTVIYGALSALLATIFYAIGMNVWILIVGAILEGLSRSLYSGNNDALLYDSLHELKNTKAFSKYLGHTSAMFQWALALSSALGGVIAYWSYSLVMWFSVIPALIGFMISIYFVEPKKYYGLSTNVYAHLKESIRLFIKNPRLRLLSLATIIGFAGSESSYQFRAAFIATVWPVWAIGLGKVLSNIGAAISFHLSERLLKKMEALRWLISSKVYGIVADLIALIRPTILSPFIMSTTSVFFGISTVSKESLLQEEFTDAQRSTLASLNSLAENLAFGVVSIFLGYLADLWSPATGLMVMKVFTVISILLLMQVFKHKSKNVAVTTA